MSEILRARTLVSGQSLQLAQGDITAEQVGAIVNAANANLAHGGGVAGAIASKGGRVIQRESEAWVRAHGRVTHDRPALTSAGNLPCRHVIHAAGPIWSSGDDVSGRADSKLALTIRSALELASSIPVDSVAFPAISTGIFGFPKERAAGVILHAIEAFFNDHPDSGLRLVRLTLYDAPTLTAFLQVWGSLYLKGE